MATVFLAEDRKHSRHVAIKIVNADAGSGADARRFQREIHLLARLQHPNILPVFDSGLANGRLWYSMPFVEGESLRARLDRDGTLDVSVAVSMLAALADALDYAHASGVVHRDIKPENILLSRSIPLLADFGIAAALEVTSDTKLTGIGMAIGTPRYMSPEQAMAEPTVDARSDIFSLGCVGFEMLAGKTPFDGPNLRAVMARMISNASPSIRASRPAVAPALDTVITRALAQNPDDRWQKGSDFSAALSAAMAESKTIARPSFVEWGSSHRSKIAGIVSAAALIAGVLILPRWSNRTSPPQSKPPATATDTAAVGAYRRGMARVQQRTQRTLVEGLALIDRAISLDSGFALAWAGRANAYNWARSWQFDIPGVSRDSLLVRALEASERALELDSLSAEAWLVSATVAAAVDPSRKDLPIHAVRRAISLDSLHARAWMQLGNTQQELGQMDSALASMRRGLVVGRRMVGTPGYANHFYWRRQYDSAAVWSDSAIKYSPRLPYAWEMAGASAIARGRYDEAKTYYEAAIRLDQGPTRVRGLEGLAEVAGIRGDTLEALKLIAQAESLVDSSAPSDHEVIALASAYATIGYKEKALRWLERYRQKGNLHFQLHLQRDLMLDPLRGEPRFGALVVR